MDQDRTEAFEQIEIPKRLKAAIMEYYPHVNAMPLIVTQEGQQIHYFDISAGAGLLLAVEFPEEGENSFRLYSIVATDWFASSVNPQYNGNLLASNIQRLDVTALGIDRYLITQMTNQHGSGIAHIEVGADSLIWYAHQALAQD